MKAHSQCLLLAQLVEREHSMWWSAEVSRVFWMPVSLLSPCLLDFKHSGDSPAQEQNAKTEPVLELDHLVWPSPQTQLTNTNVPETALAALASTFSFWPRVTIYMCFFLFSFNKKAPFPLYLLTSSVCILACPCNMGLVRGRCTKHTALYTLHLSVSLLKAPTLYNY